MANRERKLTMYRDDILRARAAAERLTLSDLAEKTGISRPTVANILKGDQTGRFELFRLKRIAEVLGVPMQQLFAPVEQASSLPSSN
jgi:transcriptional regulator with XRE-family HTH domain